jgi:hypothetical protein
MEKTERRIPRAVKKPARLESALVREIGIALAR